MTISRRDFYGTYVSGQKSICVNPITVFGWKIFQHIMPIDSKLIMVSRNTVARQNTPNRTLYVRGRGMVTNTEVGSIADRVPGLYTPERPDHPQGITTVTAVEELEFWCFNWQSNRGALPDLLPLRLQANQTVAIPINQSVFICRGELGNYGAADSFVSNGSALSATCATYGFIVENPRE